MEWSAKEWERQPHSARLELARASEHVWALNTSGGTSVLVAGMFRPVAIGFTPEIWLLICQPFRENLRRNLLDTKYWLNRLVFSRYPRVIVQIDAKYPEGQRFARFMGFKDSLERTTFEDREYLVYEVNEWR